MRVLFLWWYGPAYFRSYYLRHPEAPNGPFETQRREILDDYYGWPASVARRLSDCQCEVDIVLSDAEHLQKAWALEHDVPFVEASWRFTIPLAQIRHFEPDIVLVGSVFEYFGAYLAQIRSMGPRVYAWVSCPFPPQLDLSGIDTVLTSHTLFAKEFRRRGVKSEVLLPAFEPQILSRLGQCDRDVPLSFVGGFGPSHRRRAEVVGALSRAVPLEVWGYGVNPPVLHDLRSMVAWLEYWLGPLASLRSRYHGEVWGMDMYRVLQRSLMTLNVHIDVASGEAGNMRLFEATGLGTLVFTEATKNLSTLFQPDAEVVTYQSPKDLIDTVRHFLGHPSEAADIAAAGQRRALTLHATAQRARELCQLLS